MFVYEENIPVYVHNNIYYEFYLIIFYHPCIFECEHYSNLKYNTARVILSVHISASITRLR